MKKIHSETDILTMQLWNKEKGKANVSEPWACVLACEGEWNWSDYCALQHRYHGQIIQRHLTLHANVGS